MSRMMLALEFHSNGCCKKSLRLHEPWIREVCHGSQLAKACNHALQPCQLPCFTLCLALRRDINLLSHLATCRWVRAELATTGLAVVFQCDDPVLR